MGRDVESHSLSGNGWLREGHDVTQGPSKRAGEWLVLFGE